MSRRHLRFAGDPAAAALDVEAMTVGYAGKPVVRDIDLRLERGEVVALLGPNGAGKTTCLLGISGFLTPTAGTVRLFGEPATGRSPSALVRAGLGHVPEERCLFRKLTVDQHLDLAGRDPATKQWVTTLLPPLAALASRRAGLLSGGEQQMLALGRALMTRPSVLLIDEMSMGLAPKIVHALLEAVRRLAAEEGTAVLLVEQHVKLALGAVDRCVVLNHGSIVLTGSSAELRAHPQRLEEAYFRDFETHSALV